MRRETQLRPIAMGTSVLVALALMGVGTQAAYAEATGGGDHADAIDALAAMNGVYRTMDGQAIVVENEVGDIAERTITGRTASGEPAQIVVQASGMTDKHRQRLQDDAAAASEPSSLPAEYSTSDPGPQSGTITAAPLDLSPENWEVVSVIGTTSSSVAIAWPENDGFDVVVDGSFDGQSRDGQYFLTGLKPAQEYSIELTATRKAAPLSASGFEVASSRIMSIDTFTGRDSVDDDRIAAPLTYQPYYNQYVHKSFIPDYRVPGSQCNYFVPGWEFGGDNRSWLMPDASTPYGPRNYRTMMFVNVNWGNPAPYDMNWAKNVGATQTFYNGNLQNTLYASMDNMNFQSASAGTTYAEIYLSHSAGNPGCQLWDASYGGKISYGEWVQFYRSGTITVDGYRLPAPAHELYGAFTNSAGSSTIWRVISRRANEGFKCLLGNAICPLDFYKMSAVY